MQIVARIHFQLPGENEYSHVWARLPARASSILAFPHTFVEEEVIAAGIVVPTFGTHIAATFGTWEPSIRRHRQDETKRRMVNL